MKKNIAFVGAGALGGYVGGYFARAGLEVTLIDPWPENVEAIRARGIHLDGVTPEEQFTAAPRILHITEVQSLAKTPVDVAFVAMKSYDTAWATALIAPYLSPQGYVVSLQNCLNEETIAGIVGWGRVVGVVASLISVDLFEPGKIRRTIARGGDKHTVFRVGEPHGRVTERVSELVSWFARIDSSKSTTNLWGERWTKLVQNGMGNGVSAASGLTSADCGRDPAIRRLQIALAGEGVRVGRALGYQMEKIRGLDPDKLEAADRGEAAALAEVDAALAPRAGSNPRADIQRPSMAQDIRKGRRTEIDAMNGFVARRGAEAGVAAPANARLTEVVTRVERGEEKPSPTLLAF